MRLWMNEPLRAHTTFQIGGPAEELAAPESEEELLALLARAPALVLGAGSNLLVRDAGVAGLTVLLGKDFARIEIEGETIFAQAGARLSHLAQQAMRAGLAGLEFAAGIPGSVGGAVAMNAGAYGGQIRRFPARSHGVWLPHQPAARPKAGGRGRAVSLA